MIETEQREIREGLEAVSAALGALEQKSSESYPYPPPQVGDEPFPEAQFPPASPQPGVAAQPPEPPKTQSPIRVFTPLGGALAEGPEGEPALLNWIPSGSFVPGVLVSGLDAPTGTASSRNPHPVLIHLVGDVPHTQPAADGHSPLPRDGSRVRAARKRTRPRQA